MTRTLVVLSLLGLTAACADDAPPGPPTATGYVEATDTRVAAKVPGRVETVEVREGGRVTAGQVLARLSSPDLGLMLMRLDAERAAADAQLRLLQAGSRQEDIAQARAQRAVADSELTAAIADRDAAAADAERFAALAEQRAGSLKARDDAAARRRAAEARVQALRDRVDAADATLARLTAGARPEEVQAARARRAAVEAQIAAVNQDLADLIITAPSDGVVSARLVEPGELLAPRAPVIVLLDLARAWVWAYVDEPVVGTLSLGQAATVSTDAAQTLPGRVTFIAPRAEFTPRNVQTPSERARLVYRVKIEVDNQAGVLKPGMPVEVTWR
ncbi:MAG: HlyD family secretion protein [Vicinamibacterales bacterium]